MRARSRGVSRSPEAADQIGMSVHQPCPGFFDKLFYLPGLCGRSVELDGANRKCGQVNIAGLQGNAAGLGQKMSIRQGLAQQVVYGDIGGERWLVSVGME